MMWRHPSKQAAAKRKQFEAMGEKIAAINAARAQRAQKAATVGQVVKKRPSPAKR
ncbi:unnamed protein product [marine sediment metagenome]|uniref:Uncharacterized protein n=1 Tax=marine sediment metagenome TaxID=412755 RepID=X1Q225_9ZZZZ